MVNIFPPPPSLICSRPLYPQEVLKVPVGVNNHLLAPVMHPPLVIMSSFGLSPPPPRVMTSFMNSPLGGFPENHQNVICRQTEFFGNKTTAIKVAWNLFSELYVFSRFLNPKQKVFFFGDQCVSLGDLKPLGNPP